MDREEIMFYVFVVSRGQLISWEVVHAMRSVGELKKLIEKHFGISAKKQFMLMSNGECLDDKAMVSSYGVGAESNPIFLFDWEGFVKEDETPYMALEGFTEKIASLERMPITYDALNKRAQMALRLLDTTREHFNHMETFSRQVNLLVHSWGAAVNNLTRSMETFEKQREWQEKKCRSFLAKKEEYTATIHGMSSVLELLLHIPIDEILMKENPPPLPSSLLAWIQSECNANTLVRDYTDSCHNKLQDLTKERFEVLLKDAAQMSQDASNPNSINFNVQKIHYLEKAVSELKHLTKTVRDHAKTIVDNRDKANAAKGQLDMNALQTLCDSTLGQLRKMDDFEKKFRHVMVVSVERKNKVMETLKNKQRWIHYTQMTMAKVSERFSVFTANVRKVERQIHFIKQVRICAETYLSLLVETARRRMFADHYIKWCTKIYHISKDVCLEERLKRTDFNEKIGEHFLHDLFPGLSDRPGFLVKNLIKRFDQDIPEVDDEKIKSLASTCGKYFTPEMNAEIKKCEDNAIAISRLIQKLYHLNNATNGENMIKSSTTDQPQQQITDDDVDVIQRSDEAPVLVYRPTTPPTDLLTADYVVDNGAAGAAGESVLVHVKKDGNRARTSSDSDEFHSVSSHSAHSSTDPSDVDDEDDDDEMLGSDRRELDHQQEWLSNDGTVNVELIEKLQSENESLQKQMEANILQWEKRLESSRNDMESVMVRFEAENKARKLAWSRETIANQHLHETQEKVRGLKAQILAKTSDISDLKSELAQAANRHEIQLAETKSKYEVDLAALEKADQKAATELKDRNASLMKDIEQKQASLTQAEDRIQELETELSNSEVEVRKEKDESTAKDDVIKKLTAQVEFMEKERDNVVLVEQKQREHVVTLENKLGVSETRYKDLQQTIGDFEVKIQDNENKIQRYNDMEKKVTQLKSKLASMEKELSTLQDERDQLQTELINANKSREDEGKIYQDRIQSEREEHEKKVEEAQEQHKRALDEVDGKYKQKLMDKDTDHALVLERLREQRSSEDEERQKKHNAEMDELRTERLESEQKVKEVCDEMEVLRGEISDLKKKLCERSEAVDKAYEDSLRTAEQRENIDQHSKCSDCDNKKRVQPSQSTSSIHHLDGKNVQRNQYIINSALQRLTKTKDEKIEQLQQLLVSQSSVMSASTMSLLPLTESQASVSSASTRHTASGSGGAKEREKMTIVISNFQPDDLVLVVYDTNHRHHVLQTTNTTAKYFIHTESLNELGLSKSDDSRRFARFVEKEYCQAKKPTNRFNVPVGCKFFRVRVTPLLNKRQQKNTISS